jgi:hypothetical protein
MANMIIVNGGPKEINMNSGTGAMGPYNWANAAIGRAFTLLSKSAGNLHAGSLLSARWKQPPIQQPLFRRERRGAARGWEPLSVQFGYKRSGESPPYRMDLSFCVGNSSPLPAADADT